MINIRLIDPGGNILVIDTPDSQLIGDWLKTLFDYYSKSYAIGISPLLFRMEIKGEIK